MAIEPSFDLAAIAREQTGKFTNVEIIEETFESFQATDRFDAIMAFTVFHWLNEAVKYQKVLDLLDDSGSLVLVWNSFFQDDSLVTSEVNNAYREFFPDIYTEKPTVADVNKETLAKLNHREQEVIANPLFRQVFLKKYSTTYNYDDQTYPKLLNTFPKIAQVEESKRSKFFEHISEIIKKYGTISVPVLTTLIICQKRGFPI